jgi:Tol biopolymer transport system component
MPPRRVAVIIAAVLGTLVVVTAAALVWRDGAIEADGGRIVFSCRQPGNPWYGICSISDDGSEWRTLTREVAATDPSWSPDGRSIAFTRHAIGGEFLRATEDEIVVMGASGTGMREVTASRPGESAFDPAWSPDGEQIAFLRSSVVATDSPLRFGRLAVVSVDDGVVRDLGTERFAADPAWSPDGTRIAITVGTRRRSATVTNTDIYVIEVATLSLRALTSTRDTYESAPAWSPDGSRIAFARWHATTPFDGRRSSLHVVGSDGTGEREIHEHRHYSAGPFNLSWSPDGRSLAFETSPSILCASVSAVRVGRESVRSLTTCGRPVETAVSPDWQPTPAR